MSNKVVFFEVLGKQGPSLRAFYDGAFGWKTSQIPGSMDYGIVDGAGMGGGIGTAPEGESGRTTFYVGVDDIESALTKIESLGGRRISDARPTPDGGAIAFFEDPEGHVVGLHKAGAASHTA